MSPDRLLELLISDSPRWLGEASHHLATASAWIRDGRDPLDPQAPLLDFYRCIHAFKGACSLMAPRLTLAARIAGRLHEMEGRLAIKDHWPQAASWIPGFESDLAAIRKDLHEAWIESCRRNCEGRIEQDGGEGLPSAVRASSGGRELVFPWASILEFIPGVQVQSRPLVPVQGQLLAVVPSQGAAHDEVLFGIAVRTHGGQKIVVPVQRLELLFSSNAAESSETKGEQAPAATLARVS